MAYNVAKMADLGIHPQQFAELTPAQVSLIYAHPRDDQGRLIDPLTQIDTLVNRLAAVQASLIGSGMSLEDRQAIFASVERQWEQEHGG
jgi:hypothetical protein